MNQYGEAETVINWQRGDGRAVVFTSDSNVVRRMLKLVSENPTEVRIVHQSDHGVKVEVPTKWVSVRKPRSVNLTDEQRAAAADRMRALHSER